MISGAPKKASLPLSLNTPFPLADAWNSRVCRALFLWFKALIPVETLVPLGGQPHYILSPRYTEIRRALKFSSLTASLRVKLRADDRHCVPERDGGPSPGGKGAEELGPRQIMCACGHVHGCARAPPMAAAVEHPFLTLSQKT